MINFFCFFFKVVERNTCIHWRRREIYSWTWSGEPPLRSQVKPQVLGGIAVQKIHIKKKKKKKKKKEEEEKRSQVWKLEQQKVWNLSTDVDPQHFCLKHIFGCRRTRNISFDWVVHRIQRAFMFNNFLSLIWIMNVLCVRGIPSLYFCYLILYFTFNRIDFNLAFEKYTLSQLVFYVILLAFELIKSFTINLFVTKIYIYLKNYEIKYG